MPDYLTCSTQAFEDALGCKCAWVLNMTGVYMQGLHGVRNMYEYASIMPEYASVCLNARQYC